MTTRATTRSVVPNRGPQMTQNTPPRSTSTTRVPSNTSNGTSRGMRSQSSNRASAVLMKDLSRDGSSCSSPTNPTEKKLPPIKAQVGLAKGPDLTRVKSKIGSLENVKHKPAGGEKKAITQKLDWKASSRIGSLENAKHKPGGGELKVKTEKLEWKVQSKVGSLDNVKHKAGGGQVQIFDEKYTVGQVTSTPPSSMSASRNSNHNNNGRKSPEADETNSPFFPLCKPAKTSNTTTSQNKPTAHSPSKPMSSTKPAVAPKPAVRKTSAENASNGLHSTGQGIRA